MRPLPLMAAGLAVLVIGCGGPPPKPCPAPATRCAPAETEGRAEWLTLGCECRRAALALLRCPGQDLIVGISCINDPRVCTDCVETAADLGRAAIAAWLDRALRREAGKVGQNLDQRILTDAVKASLSGLLGDVAVRRTIRREDGGASVLVALNYANVRAYFGQMGSEGSPLGMALFRLAEVDLFELGHDAPLVILPTCPAWTRLGDAGPTRGE